MTTPYYLGLDLGQAHETTAFAVLQRSDVPVRSYAVRHLQRWPPGTSYLAIVKEVARLVAALPAKPVLAIDATAVGRPVVDLIRRANLLCPLYPITITAGHDVGAGSDGPLVPKRQLVATLQILLQTRRLRVARSLPQAGTLVAELSRFRAKMTTAANDVLADWRERDQDDLVLAIAVAAWIAENRIEPYTGLLVCWPPVPFGAARDQEARPRSRWQEIFEDLGIDPEGDW